MDGESHAHERPFLKATLERYAKLLRDTHRPERAAQAETRARAFFEQRYPDSSVLVPAP